MPGVPVEAELRDRREKPGETLVIYTDGVTEACNVGGDEYGDTRLQSSLHRSRRSPLAELLAACAGDLERFRAAAPRTDDVTMMAIRRSV